MGVRKTKNWDHMGRLLTVELPALIENGARHVMEENARIYQDEVVQMIESQDGDWEDLTEKWVERKVRLGGEADIYRFQDHFLEYLKSSKARRYVKGKYAQSKMFVGARDDIQHDGLSKAPISMYGLAVVLEEHYGRPLFDMAYERTRHEMARNWKHIAEEAGMGWK